MRNDISGGDANGGSSLLKGRLDVRILVVEDDEDLRRITKGLLDKAGYRVDAAEDGEVAWKMLQHVDYTLILTDFNMPKVTGLDLIRQLHSAHIKTPVILMTGNLPNDELRRNPDLPIEAIIIKPFSETILLDMVGNVLQGLASGGISGILAQKQSGPRLKP